MVAGSGRSSALVSLGERSVIDEERQTFAVLGNNDEELSAGRQSLFALVFPLQSSAYRLNNALTDTCGVAE